MEIIVQQPEMTRIIGDFYSGLSSSDYFFSAVNRLSNFVGANNVGFSWTNHVTGSQAYVGSDVSNDLVSLWLDAYSDEPWTAKARDLKMACMRPQTLVSEELLSSRQLRKTDFYNQVYRQADIAHMSTVAWVNDEFDLYVVCNRADTTGVFDSRELERIAPLERVVSTMGQILRSQETKATLSKASYRAQFTVLANGSYQNLEGDITQTVSTEALKIIKDFLFEPTRIKGIHIADDHRERASVLVPNLRLNRDFSVSTVLDVFILDSPLVIPDEWALTPTERSIVRGLVAGRNLRELAINNDRSYETVRKHVTNILKKSGCNSQRSLILKLLS